MTALAVLGAVLGLVSLLRSRITDLPVTPPMLYVGAGMLLAPEAADLLPLHLDDETVVFAAELTLALVLFSDAARIDTRELRSSVALPARLLGIGLPLAVAMGTVMTALLLTDLSWAEAALVAAILAPTDAALGEAVITSPSVPVRIRQALNVESGLNDGLVVPVVAVFLSLAEGADIDDPGELVVNALGEISIALVVGAIVAFALWQVIPFVTTNRWTDAEGLRLVAFGGAVAAFAGSVALGGNGFVAAFTCGLIARFLLGECVTEHSELAEDIGQIGAAAMFVIFGALMVWPAIDAATPLVAVCALGTLTLGRMIPVAVSTIGLGMQRPTIAFLGWFGPRGLASLLFGLIVVSEGHVDDPGELFSVISLVVFLSVLLHGLTASPFAQRYGAWFAAMDTEHPDMTEAMVVPETRMRGERD